MTTAGQARADAAHLVPAATAQPVRPGGRVGPLINAVNPSSCNEIIELLRQAAALDSAAPAILAEGRAPLTYGELLQQVDRTVRVLIGAGVTVNSRVAVVASTGPEMVVLFLAVAAIAACAPLNPTYTSDELEFYLRDLRPRLLIVEDGVSRPAREVAQRLDIRCWQS